MSSAVVAAPVYIPIAASLAPLLRPMAAAAIEQRLVHVVATAPLTR